MKVKVIEGIEYHIPESWDDVTLQMAISAERYELEHSGHTGIATVASYLNLEVEYVKHLNFGIVRELLKELDFVSQPLVNEPIHEFTHHDHKYFGTSMLKAEFQDFISFEQIRTEYRNRPTQALPFLIAIVAKRENETLDAYDIYERAKEFYDLPLSVARGLDFFFRVSGMMLSQDYQKILADQDNQIQQSINYILTGQTSSRGGRWFSPLVRATLRLWIKYLRYRWNKYYSSFKSGQPKLTLTQRLRKFIPRKWKRGTKGNNT